MPNKGRRAASRQAQLRRKRRRGRPRTEEFAAGPTELPQSDDADDLGEEAAAAPAPVSPAPTVQARPRTVRRVRPGAAAGVVAGSHLGGELRQAAIITAFIGVILAVLTVLLG